jgi:phosphate:Na+ symporter
MTEVILSIITVLVLFLFAVVNLSESIKNIISEKANHWIQKFTSNTFSGVIVGIILESIDLFHFKQNKTLK